jgi:Uma2 family endonuclease
VVDDESELVPDLAIVDRRTTKKDHPFTALLVIEISDTTARYDRIVKAPLYAQAGVQEYWRFDLSKRHVEVFSAPKNGQWGRHQKLSRGELPVPGFPSVTVRVEDVVGS